MKINILHNGIANLLFVDGHVKGYTKGYMDEQAPIWIADSVDGLGDGVLPYAYNEAD